MRETKKRYAIGPNFVIAWLLWAVGFIPLTILLGGAALLYPLGLWFTLMLVVVMGYNWLLTATIFPVSPSGATHE